MYTCFFTACARLMVSVYVCMYVYKATTGYAIYNVLYVVSFPDSGGIGDWE